MTHSGSRHVDWKCVFAMASGMTCKAQICLTESHGPEGRGVKKQMGAGRPSDEKPPPQRPEEGGGPGVPPPLTPTLSSNDTVITIGPCWVKHNYPSITGRINITIINSSFTDIHRAIDRQTDSMHWLLLKCPNGKEKKGETKGKEKRSVYVLGTGVGDVRKVKRG